MGAILRGREGSFLDGAGQASCPAKEANQPVQHRACQHFMSGEISCKVKISPRTARPCPPSVGRSQYPPRPPYQGRGRPCGPPLPRGDEEFFNGGDHKVLLLKLPSQDACYLLWRDPLWGWAGGPRLGPLALLSSWARGHLGRVRAGSPPSWPSSENPRHNRHDPAQAESFLIPSSDV